MGSSDRNLRAKVIRAAYEHPNLRKALLTIVKKAGRSSLDDHTLDQLVSMAAESAELSSYWDAEATSKVKSLADQFERAVEKSLDKWVADNPGALKEDYDSSDLFDEEGPYNILMTLMGHGVGIWDGRWDHFFEDKRSIDDLEKHLKRELGRWADDTGSGKLNEAFDEAAWETAASDEDRKRYARSRKAEEFKRQVDRADKLDQVDPSVAKLITQSGLQDGDRGDDVVRISRGSWPAASLKPSQTSMVLDKALGMALFMLKTGKVGGDLGALVSSDGHILDGHHRWAATILASGSKGKVGGYGANLPGRELLKVLNIASKGLFNVRNGKPGKGALASFTPANVKAKLEEFVESGIGGEHSWTADQVKQVLIDNFGSVEAGIEQMADNAKLLTLRAPSWAPDRKQMPVIEPEQVPAAANALNQGEIDWAPPYHMAKLLRKASRLPVGDPKRKAILADVQRMKARSKKG